MQEKLWSAQVIPLESRKKRQRNMPRECGCRWHEGNRPKYDQGNEEKWGDSGDDVVARPPRDIPEKRGGARGGTSARARGADGVLGWHDHSRPDVESRSPLQASY